MPLPAPVTCSTPPPTIDVPAPRTSLEAAAPHSPKAIPAPRRMPNLGTVIRLVVGQVRLEPAEARDVPMAAAFDAHQQRVVDGRRLLGPSAPDVAERAFARRGAHVVSRVSPWQLGLDDVDLVVAWLHGWVSAAVAQDPDLARHADAYLNRRLDAAEQGRLRVHVGHLDLLTLP